MSEPISPNTGSAHTQPMAVLTVEATALDQALRLLGEALDNPVSSDMVSQAARRAESGPTPPWPQALTRFGADIGLNLAAHGASLSDLLHSHSAAAMPWLAFTRQSGASVPVVVVDVHRRKARVQLPGEDPEWMSRRQLAELLEVSSEDEAIVWVSAEPAAPLDKLRSPSAQDSYDHRPLRRLRALLRAERQDLWVVVAYSVAVGLLSLVVPIAVQSLVNTVAFGSLIQPLVVLTLAVLAALGFSAVLNGFRVYVIEIIQRRIYARVAGDVAYRLLRVKAEAFDKNHGPELVNRFFDVVTVQKSAALLLMDGLSLLMQTVLGMTLLALYHPLLLAFDLFLILAITLIIFVMGRGAVQSAIKESKAKYATAAWLEEMAALTRTFKAGGSAQFAMERADRLARDYLTYRQLHFRIFMRQVIGSLALQAIASAALLGVGGFLVMDRQLTLGQLVAAELIVTVVVGGFSKFGKKFETFYDLLAAIDKLGALIDLPLERLGGETLVSTSTPAAVHFRDVSYKLGGQTILNGANWELPAGSAIGLTGPTGAGKTALADLLFGLRKPSGGVLTIDNIDLRDLCLEELREQVAIVHDTEIFSGTVLENVSVGRPGIDSSHVRAALATVGLLDDIADLPEGIRTQLSMSGRPLSPGQAARLALARAIVGRPRLLVLDGAFEKIDEPDLRSEIAERIFAKNTPWTLLCISSHPDLLRRCESRYLLGNGSLTELAGTGGDYRGEA